MSNKDNESKNTQQLFSEDITKRLVKKILDDNPDDVEMEKEKNVEKKSDFNIEYEEYDPQEFDQQNEDFEEEEYYEDSYEEFDDYNDYDDYEDYEENYEPRRSSKKNPSNVREFKRSPRPQNTQNNSRNNYRKNIERYGKEFFDDDYDDYDDNPPSLVGRVISFSIIIVLTISTAFLTFSLIVTKKDLKEADAKVQELLDNKEATEIKITEDALKQENESLKQENQDLKAQLNPNSQNTTNQNNNNQTNKPSSNSGNNSNSSSNSSYTVKEGDTIWKISQTVYGNGAHFQKILDANGLKENSVLKPGQKLTIPKIN